MEFITDEGKIILIVNISGADKAKKSLIYKVWCKENTQPNNNNKKHHKKKNPLKEKKNKERKRKTM